MLKARLLGGVLSKARRGELRSPLPVGLVYGPDEKVALDPDQQVQQALRLLFQTFNRTGSAWSTVQIFRQQGLMFPRRVHAGPHKDELVWVSLLHCRALQILKNPRYAGAFFFGRTHTRKTIDGRQSVDLLPREQWHTLLPDAHPGYISWTEYEENLRRLRENAQAYGAEHRKSPPREGPALLQGLAVCGRCGERMTVRYHLRGTHPVPDYVCQRQGIEHGDAICQRIPGSGLDEAIGELLVGAVTPLALEVAMTVQQELCARAHEADRLRQQQVERARYETDLAQRRYMRVDPDNRLVADTLEADWNQKLRALVEARKQYELGCQADRLVLGEQQRAEISALATDFPRLWRDPRTPDRERKRMVRLILEDVTLSRGEQITAYVRFKGGATRTLNLPIPPPAWQQRQTRPMVVKEIDHLLDEHTDAEIGAILNERGVLSGSGQSFNPLMVANIRRTYGLVDRYSRLRAQGMLTIQELADVLGVCNDTVKRWHLRGLLRAHAHNDKGECLYELPPENLPVKGKRKGEFAQQQSPRSYLQSNG